MACPGESGAVYLGGFGAHRFYVGKIVTGIRILLTLGGLGVWVRIDVILIVTNSFRDGRRRLRKPMRS